MSVQIEKIRAYDAALLCLERTRDALGCIRTMLHSDLWPGSAEAFEHIIANQIAGCDGALGSIRKLSPGEA